MLNVSYRVPGEKPVSGIPRPQFSYSAVIDWTKILDCVNIYLHLIRVHGAMKDVVTQRFETDFPQPSFASRRRLAKLYRDLGLLTDQEREFIKDFCPWLADPSEAKSVRDA